MAHYAGRAFDSARFGSVQFWVGVGGQDNNPADVPRQWDPYEGNTRVQRAQAFEAAMQQLGAAASLHVFGSARHEVTRDMGNAACAFLGGAMLRPTPAERAAARTVRRIVLPTESGEADTAPAQARARARHPAAPSTGTCAGRRRPGPAVACGWHAGLGQLGQSGGRVVRW